MDSNLALASQQIINSPFDHFPSKINYKDKKIIYISTFQAIFFFRWQLSKSLIDRYKKRGRRVYPNRHKPLYLQTNIDKIYIRNICLLFHLSLWMLGHNNRCLAHHFTIVIHKNNSKGVVLLIEILPLWSKHKLELNLITRNC